MLDKLKEHYSVAVSERTTRRFVEQLRKQHDLPKNTAKVRHYLAMEDPPMGRQMQVDLGVVHIKDARNYQLPEAVLGGLSAVPLLIHVG